MTRSDGQGEGFDRRRRRRSSRWSPCLFAGLAVFLCLGGAVPGRADDRVAALRDAVVVRQSPSEAAAEITRIDAGETLRSFGQRGDWLNVQVEAAGTRPATSGWVRRTDVADVPPAPSADSQP